MKKINLVFIILGIIFGIFPIIWTIWVTSYHRIFIKILPLEEWIKQSNEENRAAIFGVTFLFTLWILYCIINVFKNLLKK